MVQMIFVSVIACPLCWTVLRCSCYLSAAYCWVRIQRALHSLISGTSRRGHVVYIETDLVRTKNQFQWGVGRSSSRERMLDGDETIRSPRSCVLCVFKTSLKSIAPIHPTSANKVLLVAWCNSFGERRRPPWRCSNQNRAPVKILEHSIL